jgi:hypothetical protein
MHTAITLANGVGVVYCVGGMQKHFYIQIVKMVTWYLDAIVNPWTGGTNGIHKGRIAAIQQTNNHS